MIASLSVHWFAIVLSRPAAGGLSERSAGRHDGHRREPSGGAIMYLTRRQTVSRCSRAPDVQGGGPRSWPSPQRLSRTGPGSGPPTTYGHAFTLSTFGGRLVSASIIHGGGNLSAQQYSRVPPARHWSRKRRISAFNLQGSGTADLEVRVHSVADTTLIVYTPDDEWLSMTTGKRSEPRRRDTVGGSLFGGNRHWVGTFESSGLPSAVWLDGKRRRPVSGASGAGVRHGFGTPMAPAVKW